MVGREWLDQIGRSGGGPSPGRWTGARPGHGGIAGGDEVTMRRGWKREVRERIEKMRTVAKINPRQIKSSLKKSKDQKQRIAKSTTA